MSRRKFVNSGKASSPATFVALCRRPCSVVSRVDTARCQVNLTKFKRKTLARQEPAPEHGCSTAPGSKSDCAVGRRRSRNMNSVMQPTLGDQSSSRVGSCRRPRFECFTITLSDIPKGLPFEMLHSESEPFSKSDIASTSMRSDIPQSAIPEPAHECPIDLTEVFFQLTPRHAGPNPPPNAELILLEHIAPWSI